MSPSSPLWARSREVHHLVRQDLTHCNLGTFRQQGLHNVKLSLGQSCVVLFVRVWFLKCFLDESLGPVLLCDSLPDQSSHLVDCLGSLDTAGRDHPWKYSQS